MTAKIDYLGVEKDALAQSIKRGVDLVEQFNLGPHVAADLKAWNKRKPLEKIAASSDRKALAKAMNETGTRGMFRRMSDLFTAAALAEKPPYSVRPVLRDLSRWGAFDGLMTHEYRDTDYELERKKLQILAARAAKQPRKKREQAMAEFIAAVALTQPRQVVGLEEMRDIVMPDIAKTAALLARFDSGSLNVRHRMI